jgi:hypothetical protein
MELAGALAEALLLWLKPIAWGLVREGMRIARGSSSLEHAEQEEAGERCETKNHGRLSACEVRCRMQQLFDRLSTHIAREFLDFVGCAPHQISQLRGVLTKAVGRTFGGLGNVARQIGAGRELLIQKALCLLIGFGSEGGSGLFGMAAGLLSDLG